MPDWIADYHVVAPLDDPARPGSRWLATAPGRLGLGGASVVIEVGPGEPADLLPDLSRWAAAAAGGGTGLVVPLEVGPLEGGAPGAGAAGDGGTPAVWLSRLAEIDHRPGADPVAVVAGAARGLAALHAAGGVHGAVTAGRILATPGGGILDLPPLRGRAVPGLIATVESTAGLDALAPEVARGEGPSPASDIWALAACLHLALTGQGLHPGLEHDVLLDAVQRVAFEPPGIDAGEASELLAACCRLDPAQRPAATAVAAALDGLAGRRRSGVGPDEVRR